MVDAEHAVTQEQSQVATHICYEVIDVVNNVFLLQLERAIFEAEYHMQSLVPCCRPTPALGSVIQGNLIPFTVREAASQIINVCLGHALELFLKPEYHVIHGVLLAERLGPVRHEQVCCAVVGVFQISRDAAAHSLLFCIIGAPLAVPVHLHHPVLTDIKLGDIARLGLQLELLQDTAVYSSGVTRNGDMTICVQVDVDPSSVDVSQVHFDFILKRQDMRRINKQEGKTLIDLRAIPQVKNIY